MGKKTAGILGAAAAAVTGLAVRDFLQPRHAILRNYPVLGHARYMLETIRPEMQQYFIERNWDGRPFDRNTRSLIYSRAKGATDTKAFGTEENVSSLGHRTFLHSMHPVEVPETPPRVRIGGRDCTQPYDMALMNVSAMSFGSLSGRAIESLNKGAAMGGFAHDTGEGAISPHHRKHGGDLIWELGTGYFGARTPEGGFDDDIFAKKARDPQVKMTSLKLSQGAKPGLGGELPGSKVTPEVAEIRGIPVGETFLSPPGHTVFDDPEGLLEFIARMRRLSGGKPAGFKLCVGSRVDFLAVCKAMKTTGILPDFIIVDGSEGGTGAAPQEFEDHVGLPLTQGLIFVHNALVGIGVRNEIAVGASGRIAAANDVVRRLAQGADFTNSARAMMMAVGCIQAQRCHVGTCPVGVATQDPRRERGIDVEDKSKRVARYQQATVREALRIMAAMGVSDPGQLRPWMVRINDGPGSSRTYADNFEWLEPGCLNDPATVPESWRADWEAADAKAFYAVGPTRREVPGPDMIL